MKFTPLIAAASVAVAAIVSAPISAQTETRTVVTVGAPDGPGWVSYHERTYSHDWDGPRYYDAEGPHHGARGDHRFHTEVVGRSSGRVNLFRRVYRLIP